MRFALPRELLGRLQSRLTASSRASIAVRLVSGARSHCRRSRDPIGVSVRSSTPSSVPPLLASAQRFDELEISACHFVEWHCSTRPFDFRPGEMRNATGCSSCRYRISAPAAANAGLIDSVIPIPSMEATPNCRVSSVAASPASNSHGSRSVTRASFSRLCCARLAGAQLTRDEYFAWRQPRECCIYISRRNDDKSELSG